MTTERKRIHLAVACAAMTMLSTEHRVVLVSSFAVQPQPPYQQQQQQHSVKRYAAPPSPTNTGDDDTEEDDEPSLVIGSDNIAKEMQTVKQAGGDYDFGQIDFLALAKERAKNKPASQNNVGTDADWTTLAAQKKEQFGEVDDWENSQKEEGNADSQILMFTDPPPSSGDGDGDGDGDNNEDDEPKLLLF